MAKRHDLTGNQYESLTVIKLDEEKTKSKGRTYWVCKCKCGNIVSVLAGNLIAGTTTSCGCSRKKQLQGQRFGSFVVIDKDYEMMKTRKDHREYWRCLCDCGNYFTSRDDTIVSGRVKSCGCSRKHNSYKLIDDEYYIVYDLHGDYFFIDKDDYECVNAYTWIINNEGYVYSCNEKLLLHRLLMNANENDEIDHKNGVRHDCRKSNLRYCTRTQNTWNSTIPKNNTSGVKGVSFYKSRNKWVAYITIHKKHKNLGYYTNYYDAVKARLDAEKKYFKDWSIYEREPFIIDTNQ